MAIVATSQVLHDGVRNVVVQLNGYANADSGSNNESAVTKVDVSEFIPAGDRQLKVKKITANINGGAVQLFWDAVDPIPLAYLTDLADIDYSFVGGMDNPGTQESSTSGDILLSTIGFDVNSSYSIKLEMVKT